MQLDKELSEVLSDAQKQKLQQLTGWITSPVWVELIKPAIIKQINELTKAILKSHNPEEDQINKARIEAFAWFLDFENQFRKLLEEQKAHERFIEDVVKAEGTAIGTPYREAPTFTE